MAVDPLSASRAYLDAARAAQRAAGTEAGDSVDFGALVQDAVRQATQTTAIAEQQAAQVAAGRGDIVDVVTAIAAAEAQLETVMAVRDQVIQAYQEILRMPI
ncbi:MAG: flagellar hook-basal body complex protein FliE [Hydrogenophilaceae bacterium]|jgi:flagellar hook-basal body complex protein FliE|nr:flagellar hook-basal body complex protein FliE [Hydrogenophilaceae bacterium]